MEKNINENKKNTGIIIFFILLLAIIITLAYILFKTSMNSNEQDKTIKSQETRISELENIVQSLQKNSSNKNTISSQTTTDSKYIEITKDLDGIDVFYVTDVVENNDNSYTLKGVIYSQYTITSAEMNKILENNTFELCGKSYTVKENYDVYDSSHDFPVYKFKKRDSDTFYLESQAQISNVWKLTNKFREITLDGNVIVENAYTEESSSIKKTFKNFTSNQPIETTNPSPAYRFEFDGNTCVKVIECTTAI